MVLEEGFMEDLDDGEPLVNIGLLGEVRVLAFFELERERGEVRERKTRKNSKKLEKNSKKETKKKKNSP